MVQSHRLGGLKILVADDCPDNQKLIRFLLRRQGAQLDVVDNGLDAVNKALNNSYDAVIMDLAMPVLDGYAATAELRRRGFTKDIIALTAHAFPEFRERCRQVGCSEYLTKPFKSESLIQILERCAAH